MHPNSSFRWTDVTAMQQFICAQSFAHIFVSSEAGPMAAHVPVCLTSAGHLQFHLAQNNRMVPHLPGATALISVGGANAYISPDWYAGTNQVPTWIYQTVEAVGIVHLLSLEELIAQLDALSGAMEQKLLPKPPWTRAKMLPGRFEAMLPGIVGFELQVQELRGTRKLNQHKPAADIEGMLEGLRLNAQHDMVAVVESYLG